MTLSHPNKKRFCRTFFFLALFSFMTINCYAFDITIDVSPNVLNLQNNGQVVTVHTDIDYDLVQVSTVYLNDVAIDSWKSDLNGNFVAKFVMDEIKDLDLNIDEYNTLTLDGYTTEDESFLGSQDVLVINNLPSNPE